MGEVYRACDTRLNRTVAIKILPATLSADPQLRDRFEREARVISQLAHPHICRLYDVGEQDGIRFLVLEYLEGETLAKRLERGPMKADEALPVAIALAATLERAHRHGIVHRDLKPGNIMLTRDGAKLLDFGLAKPHSHAAVSDLTATDLTSQGTILGTVHYMSPEQVEGKEADARSDIFAFGAVLFEMTTGTRAFHGSSAASVMAAIVAGEPPPTPAGCELPAMLEWIVKRCLAKNPDDRWQTAGDLAAALRWVARAPDSPSMSQAAGVEGRRSFLLRSAPWIVAVAVGGVAVVWRETVPAPRPINFVVQPPENTTFVPFGHGGAALSPDGQRLAFIAAKPDGTDLLWIRSLDEVTATAVPGVAGVSAPVWSPDSRELAFFADRKLRKLALPAGAIQVLADVEDARSATWSRDGVIVFASDDGRLARVSASGGPISPVGSALVEGEQASSPVFLPDGQRFLYRSVAPRQPSGIYVGSLGGKDRVFVSPADSGAVYSAGRLLFLRGTELITQPFDTTRLTMHGQPSVIARNVETSRSGASVFTVSDDGVLAILTGALADRRLVWFDRQGRRLEIVNEEGAYRNPVLSPDGTRVAVDRMDAITSNPDLWLIDLTRGVTSRLTHGPAGSLMPVWSPDGTRIAYAVVPGYKPAQLSLATLEAVPVLFGDGADAFDGSPRDWSSDHKYLLVQRATASQTDLWVVPTNGGGKPRPAVQSPATEVDGRFSPNAKWIAYSSDASGRFETYMVPFDAAGRPTQISTGGGFETTWRRDGKEIFYLTPERTLMAVDVDEGPPLRLGTPQPLFEMPTHALSGARNHYDVTADGQRFLVTEEVRRTTPVTITVMINWAAGVK